MLRENKIAIVGIQGLPAKYGGFETLAENLVKYRPNHTEIVVWCSKLEYRDRPKIYNGVELKYLPLRANGWQGILFDSVALFLSRNYGKILLLGVNGAAALTFNKIASRTVLNIGGLDFQRSKWSSLSKKVILLLNNYAIRRSSLLVADNEKIKSYLLSEHNKESILIGYGFSIADRPANANEVISGRYYLNIARIQEDNNCHVILDAFVRTSGCDLIMIGNFSHSSYGKRLKEKYKNVKNIRLMEAFYDRSQLKDILYNAKGYVHGHSAGGTNPILVDYMSQSRPIFAYRNGFNQYTLGSDKNSWNNAEELMTLLNVETSDFIDYRSRLSLLNWETVAEEYFRVLCR